MNPMSEYSALDTAFNHFNERLFKGALPPAMIVLRNHPKARGYFRYEGFKGRKKSQTVNEISLCANTHDGRSDKEILSTLVHEMVHHQQFEQGEPSRQGYHNSEWAGMMDEVGLTPSSTGKPGGKRTGQRVSHYIVEGGPFDTACDDLLRKGFSLNWQDHYEPKAAAKKPPTRVKFTCPECRVNTWGKPSLAITCTECELQMEAAK